MRWRTWSAAAVCLLAAGSVRADYVTFSTDPEFVRTRRRLDFAVRPRFDEPVHNGKRPVGFGGPEHKLTTPAPAIAGRGLYRNATTAADAGYGHRDLLKPRGHDRQGYLVGRRRAGDLGGPEPTLSGAYSPDQNRFEWRAPGEVGKLNTSLQGVDDAGVALLSTHKPWRRSQRARHPQHRTERVEGISSRGTA